MLKRAFDGDEGEEDGGSSSVHQIKRQRSLPSALGEMMRLQSMEDFPFLVESFLRPVVRDEAEKAIFYCLSTNARSSFHQISSQGARPWRLQFINKLPHTLFVGSRIYADDKSPVQISIVDCVSNMIIQSGSLASIKAKILVVDGEFGAGAQTNWTEEEFNNNLVCEREGKRPLLTGDLLVTLKDGVGSFGEITFTDNSSWIRSRQFRLGVKAQQCNLVDGDVQEAVSGAFLVKDHRGELYKKHHPPSLSDEVWRLKKIGKDGVFHRRLAEKGVNTVQDFLQLLAVNEGGLRDILGTGMTNKIWDAITEHARECSLDDKVYMYTYDQHIKVYLNSIFEVTGAQFGSIYQPFSALNVKQKVFVNKLREIIYATRNSALEDPELSSKLARPMLMTNTAYSSASVIEDHLFKPEDDLAIRAPSQPTLPYDVYCDNPQQLKYASHVGEETLGTKQPTIFSGIGETLQIQSGEFQHDPYQINYRSEIQPAMSNDSISGNLNSQGIVMLGTESFSHQTAALMQASHPGFQQAR